MKMTNSPDDLCGVCQNRRDEHGDVNHKFSLEGRLEKLEPAPPPREQAPVHRDDPKMPMMPGGNINLAQAISMEHNFSLRLMETLVDKGLLDAKDVIHILGGHRLGSDDGSASH